MAKPATFDGYSDRYTADCERVLVTPLRGLGPWKESVFPVGGLTPRYLVAARPPEVPAHAGTLDVDVVVDQQILADTAGYRTLEENLRGDGVRAVDERKRPEALVALADAHRKRRADGGRAARRRTGDCRWQG